MNRFNQIFQVPKPVIGMVHLRPLPGAPLYDTERMGMEQIIETAVMEAKLLEDAGVDGVQVENMWDIPYLRGGDISHETTAALSVCVHEVSKTVNIPVGTECHMNGGIAALACAVAGSAKWVRVFEWCNAFISQSGYIEAIGGELARMRKNLDAVDIAFLCDVNVKHGSHFIIHDRSIEEQSQDIEAQGGDAVIVTGFDTGMPPSPERIKSCRSANDLPVLVGSGLGTENVPELLGAADGAIVGSYFKRDGNWKNEIDYEKVKGFMEAVSRLRG